MKFKEFVGALSIIVVGVAVFLTENRSASASTFTLNFDNLSVPGTYVQSVGTGTYVTDGYGFTESGPYGFSAVQTGDPRYTGQPAIFNNNGGDLAANEAETVLAPIAGGTFNIYSISLAPTWTTSITHSITFDGQTSAGTTVEESFSIPGGSYTLELFAFNSDFQNLTSLDWYPQPVYNTIMQFDDLVLSTPVPEPSSLLVWLLVLRFPVRCLGVGGKILMPEIKTTLWQEVGYARHPAERRNQIKSIVRTLSQGNGRAAARWCRPQGGTAHRTIIARGYRLILTGTGRKPGG
jgi:hypothetical protein